MSMDTFADRSLFGGAMIARREQRTSSPRSPDESLIFEMLELKIEVLDQGSAAWFLQHLAHDQDAEGTVILEQSSVLEVPVLTLHRIPSAISKGRQGREAQNIVKVYLANIRLKGVHTDILITAHEPIFINSLSESADTVDTGVQVPGVHSGRTPMAEVFRRAVSSFRVNDWSIFGAAI